MRLLSLDGVQPAAPATAGGPPPPHPGPARAAAFVSRSFRHTKLSSTTPTTALLQDALDSLMVGRTTIMIAHRWAVSKLT